MEKAANHGYSPQPAVTNFPGEIPLTADEMHHQVVSLIPRHLAELSRMKTSAADMLRDMHRVGLSLSHADYLAAILDTADDAITSIMAAVRRQQGIQE